jgi:hypothetical protein
MAQEPFIGSENRPDLTIDLESRVGDLTVRQLSDILGRGAAPAKLKELTKDKEFASDKLPYKEPKDQKDLADNKAHKDPKDQKDHKDNKDHKDPKDQKDQKDQKDPKDHKDQKDNKDQKDPKDPKEQKDIKDHKDPKDSKDHKDIKDRKENKEHKEKEPADKLPEVENPPAGTMTAGPSGLDDLIRRVSGLEQDVVELQQKLPRQT